MIDDEKYYGIKSYAFPDFPVLDPAIKLVTDMYPQRTHADLLHSLFFKNIDPFIKLLHQPRFYYDLSQYRRGTIDHSADFEALLFAMYYLTLISLDNDFVYANLGGESKEALMERYKQATQQALAKCGFIQRPNLMSLQAYLLYLVSGEPNYFLWPFTCFYESPI